MKAEYVGFAIVIIVLIIITCAQAYMARRAHMCTFAQFASGFWRASSEDCEAGGYSDAYLYIAPTECARATGYIVAVSAVSVSDGMNSAIDLAFAPSGASDARASLAIDGEVSQITITCDHARCEMRWIDADGETLFTWTKNGNITRALDVRADADDSARIAV